MSFLHIKESGNWQIKLGLTSIFDLKENNNTMEDSKFHQLCSAYSNAQNNFETYKTDCHILAMEIVRELKSYYELPDSQFSLYKINAQNGFDLVTPALIHAIEIGQDNYWHFGIGITVCQAAEVLPKEVILIHLLYRKNDKGENFIKYVHSETEYKFTKGEPESYISFFDFLFTTIITSYQGHLQQFVGSRTERKLGYRS